MLTYVCWMYRNGGKGKKGYERVRERVGYKDALVSNKKYFMLRGGFDGIPKLS